MLASKRCAWPVVERDHIVSGRDVDLLDEIEVVDRDVLGLAPVDRDGGAPPGVPRDRTDHRRRRRRLQPDLLGLRRARDDLHGQPPAVRRRGDDRLGRLAEGEHRIALGEAGQLPRSREPAPTTASPPARRGVRPPRSPPAATGASRPAPGPTGRWRHRPDAGRSPMLAPAGTATGSAPARRPVRQQRPEADQRSRAGRVLEDEGGGVGLEGLPVEPRGRLPRARGRAAGPGRRGTPCR